MNKLLYGFILIVLSVTILNAENLSFIQLKQVAVSKIPDDMIIPELGSVTIDSKGNVFAFSGKNNGSECWVIKWDKDLRFIKKFSRNGHGPGEITMNGSTPHDRLSIDPLNDDLVVIDQNPLKFVIFDNNGNYKADIDFRRNNPNMGGLRCIKSLGNGAFICIRFLRKTYSNDNILFTLNSMKVKNIKILWDFNDKNIYIDDTCQFVSDVYGSNCFIDIDSGYSVFGNSQFYRFQVFDNNGNKKLDIQDPSKKLRTFTSKEMDYIKKKYLSPKDGESRYYNEFLTELNRQKSKINKLLDLIEENKNIIRDIKIGGGRIYVFLVGDDVTIEDRILTVIYDLKGNILKKVYFKKIPDKIWKNYVFYTDYDEEDNPIILKYQIMDRL